MTEWILSSSILILVILILRALLQGHIRPRLQYALWALVLLRLLIPFSFFSAGFSVGTVAQRVEQQAGESVILNTKTPVMSYESAYEQVAQRYESQGIVIDESNREEVESEAYEVQYSGPTVGELLEGSAGWIWIIGCACAALWLTAVNLAFGIRLRKSRVALDRPGCPLPVYQTDAVQTPCLFGLFRPAIYLTAEVTADETALHHALTHELTHYRHGDHIWAFLRCVCLAVHWYNPLVWIAAMISRRDGELACDEGTIARLGEDQRIRYGETLIAMTCIRKEIRDLSLTATTMVGGKKALTQRIRLIAARPRNAVFALVIAVLVVSIAVGCTFTGAETQPDSTPDTSAGPYYYGEGLPITEEEERMITEAYWERYCAPYIGSSTFCSWASSANDLSVRLMGRFDDAYAVFVDGERIYSPVWSTDFENWSNGEGVRYPSMQTLEVYYDGSFYPVYYAWRYGILTDEDLDELQANLQELLLFPDPPELEERVWPEGLEDEVWQSYATDEVHSGNVEREDYKLVYCGSYDGAIAVFAIAYEPVWPGYISPNSYHGFVFPVFGGYLDIYYDGVLYNLWEAYDNGIVTDADLMDFQEYYTWYVNGLFNDELYMEWYIDWQNSEWNWRVED